MNASKGLQRVSAVWWGFIGLLLAGTAVFAAKDAEKLYAPVILAGTYGLHWVTSWIVKGFFGDGE